MYNGKVRYKTINKVFNNKKRIVWSKLEMSIYKEYVLSPLTKQIKQEDEPNDEIEKLSESIPKLETICQSIDNCFGNFSIESINQMVQSIQCLEVLISFNQVNSVHPLLDFRVFEKLCIIINTNHDSKEMIECIACSLKVILLLITKWSNFVKLFVEQEVYSRIIELFSRFEPDIVQESLEVLIYLSESSADIRKALITQYDNQIYEVSNRIMTSSGCEMFKGATMRTICFLKNLFLQEVSESSFDLFFQLFLNILNLDDYFYKTYAYIGLLSIFNNENPYWKNKFLECDFLVRCIIVDLGYPVPLVIEYVLKLISNIFYNNTMIPNFDICSVIELMSYSNDILKYPNCKCYNQVALEASKALIKFVKMNGKVCTNNAYFLLDNNIIDTLIECFENFSYSFKFYFAKLLISIIERVIHKKYLISILEKKSHLVLIFMLESNKTEIIKEILLSLEKLIEKAKEYSFDDGIIYECCEAVSSFTNHSDPNISSIAQRILWEENDEKNNCFAF